MIGRLSGLILEKRPPALLVDVQGVGYELEAPMSTFYDLPGVGERVTLFTHLMVREDAHILYAFSRDDQRQLFRALLKVSGVGAKMALAILSGMSTGDFAVCVQADDALALTRLPGIGKKTAERLIIEMRDRLDKIPMGQGISLPAATAGAQMDSPVADAVSALTALGYKPLDASRMVRAVAGEGMASEEIIRAALKGALG
ncbi:MAG: Holliday junction branch migration protein RuvA [Gammaproteobacteria bacterium]|nr:Holliday junction branch migration protein RuvA [Gammaproteobacteria bacterium]MBU1654249.1 Holliday junction branch migration protein RuvA [Gammaproteobacteria bacterium]MBU1960397.1 Holliday junction branch migration protein RuvA [Gammaproteobacteria bacterium]